jgi:hypothetical protein
VKTRIGSDARLWKVNADEFVPHSTCHCNRPSSALARFRRAGRIRSRRLQVVVGVLSAAPGSAAHLFPPTLGSAVRVSPEATFVAVTGLIAGWLGSAVALLFLTGVTFAGSATLAASLLSVGLDVIVATVCVLGVRAHFNTCSRDEQRRCHPRGCDTGSLRVRPPASWRRAFPARDASGWILRGSDNWLRLAR